MIINHCLLQWFNFLYPCFNNGKNNKCVIIIQAMETFNVAEFLQKEV